MNIWIITVNFGDTAPTREFIGSIENSFNKKGIKVFIADNQSTRKSKKDLKEIKNNSKLSIKIISYNKNIFYWPSIKKTLKNNIKSIKDYPDWMLLCNNDIAINDKNFFNILSKFNPKEYPVIGPKIINQYGKSLNPFMIEEMNNLKKYFWKFYFKSYTVSKILNFILKIKNIFTLGKTIDEMKKVYAIHGSAVILSNFFFKNGGYLDDGFELFCEELTLAEITKKIGHDIYFIPDLEVIHNEHSSMKNIDKRKRYRMAKNSHFYFAKEYLKE